MLFIDCARRAASRRPGSPEAAWARPCRGAATVCASTTTSSRLPLRTGRNASTACSLCCCICCTMAPPGPAAAGLAAIARVMLSLPMASRALMIRSTSVADGFVATPSTERQAGRARQVGLQAERVDQFGELRGVGHRPAGADSSPVWALIIGRNGIDQKDGQDVVRVVEPPENAAEPSGNRFAVIGDHAAEHRVVAHEHRAIVRHVDARIAGGLGLAISLAVDRALGGLLG